MVLGSVGNEQIVFSEMSTVISDGVLFCASFVEETWIVVELVDNSTLFVWCEVVVVAVIGFVVGVAAAGVFVVCRHPEKATRNHSPVAESYY